MMDEHIIYNTKHRFNVLSCARVQEAFDSYGQTQPLIGGIQQT